MLFFSMPTLLVIQYNRGIWKFFLLQDSSNFNKPYVCMYVHDVDSPTASGSTPRSDDAHGLQPSSTSHDASLRRNGHVHRQTNADQEVPPGQTGGQPEKVPDQEEEEEGENLPSKERVLACVDTTA